MFGRRLRQIRLTAVTQNLITGCISQAHRRCERVSTGWCSHRAADNSAYRLAANHMFAVTQHRARPSQGQRYDRKAGRRSYLECAQMKGSQAGNTRKRTLGEHYNRIPLRQGSCQAIDLADTLNRLEAFNEESPDPA